jgi:nucleoside-diphosphate-sugar epimerase/predicted dehydrogenase
MPAASDTMLRAEHASTTNSPASPANATPKPTGTRQRAPGGVAKVGLLGAGYILQAHAKAVQSANGAQLYAVCDLSRSRAESAAEAYGIEHVFTSIDDLCSSDVDSVHVLLPPALHLDAARKLVAAGKHVLLEKPMGIGSLACRSVVEQAAQRGVRLGVSHNFLFTSAYEEVRRKLHAGEFGPLDHVHVQWLYALGLIQFGPYDNWMLRQPQNLVFELGSHLSAFVVDLVGEAEVVAAEAGDPIDLPGQQRVYRQWMGTLRAGRTAVQFALSANPGYPERSVRLRGLGGAAMVDFERNLAISNRVGSTSALFDNLGTARSQGAALMQQGQRNFMRSFLGALKKDSTANAFHESVARAVTAFYRFGEPLDRRLDGVFGVEVMSLCERIASKAGIDPLAPRAQAEASGVLFATPSAPDILVIGGTGFIGKRLVQQLVSKGYSVRVLTRGRHAADIELGPLGVDIVQGHHGDPVLLDKILPETRVVIHLAKALGQKWQDYVDHDVKPTRVLAEKAVQHKVQRFIYTGTIDSYYSAGEGDVITGDTPLDPQIAKRNLYARSKAACEAMLTEMHRKQGLPLVTFRPGIVIGAGSPPAHWGVGMFHSDARVDLWGADDHPLPFVLVDDVADALVRGVDKQGIEGQTFLLTDAPVLSGNQYVEELERLAGVKINVRRIPAWRHFAEDAAKEAVKNMIRHPNRRMPSLRDWDCRSHRARYDSTKTQTVLDWHPAGTRERIVQDGIAASVEHFYRR